MPEKFAGFPDQPVNMTQIPTPFFEALLPLVDDLAELKVLLFCFWALPQKEGRFPYLLRRDFSGNAPLMDGLATIDPDTDTLLDVALARAVEREALLSATVTVNDAPVTLYFVNTAKGRTAVQQIKAGHWTAGDFETPVEILPERPNIYRLYEENIGPLTPMLADELKDLESSFDTGWIADAFREAVLQNKRSLRYIRAILERWQRDGRDDKRGRADDDGQRYITGKYADFINH